MEQPAPAAAWGIVSIGIPTAYSAAARGVMEQPAPAAAVPLAAVL